MATTIKLGQEVTIGTTPTEYVIDETNAKIDKPFFAAIIYTTSGNSGTIKFSVGETPPSTQRAVAADKTVVMQGILNGTYNLWAVGSASGQKFTVS